MLDFSTNPGIISNVKMMKGNEMSGVELLLSDSRGVYIPRDFATECPGWQMTRADRKILEAGPDHEQYWDVWHDVSQYSSYTDKNGNTWYLWLEGDVFAYCHELMTDEEYENLFGEPRHQGAKIEQEQKQEEDLRDLVLKLDRKLDQILDRLNNQNMF